MSGATRASRSSHAHGSTEPPASAGPRAASNRPRARLALDARAPHPPIHGPRAWVLNLDAEHELAVGRRYAPTRHLAALVARERRRLLGSLVGPLDVVLTEDRAGDERARGLPGLAWCPTPRALARLRAAGALPVVAPALEVLQRVNARPFALAVRAPLAEGSFAKEVAPTLEEARDLLARPAPAGWLVRRTFGAAGRGRRRIAAGRLDSAEIAWLAAGLRRGPLVVEPWVEVTRELTRSAWVRSDGAVVIAPPCFQETTRTGAWTRTELAERGALDRRLDARLAETVEAAGAALVRAGYFGPFGIDAYLHRVRDGHRGLAGHRVPGGRREVLNPLSEINARFTMDWATGMAAEPAGGEAFARLDALGDLHALGDLGDLGHLNALGDLGAVRPSADGLDGTALATERRTATTLSMGRAR